MDKPPPAKAPKTGPVAPQSSMSNMSNMAFRHVLRFVPAYTLANVECVTPRMGQVARAAVVELAAFRFGITVEPVSGCAWRLLVQEGLASAGCVGLAVGLAHGMLVDPDATRGPCAPKASALPIELTVKWVLHKAHLHAYAATGGFNLRFSLNFMIFVIIKVQNLYRVILKVPRNKTLNLDYWYSALIFQKNCKISQNLKSPKKLKI